MKFSTQLIVLGLVAALGPLTAGSAQAAETSYQAMQDTEGGAQIVGNDTAIAAGGETTFARDSFLANSVALLQMRPLSLRAAQNVALAANGAVASASSTGVADGPLASVDQLIDGTRSGANSYWTDDTADEFPDVAQINFFGNKTIDRVVVYSVQDNYFDGIDPTDTDQCFVYGLVDFTVQGWNGRDWVTLADVINNDLCKRTLTFPPFTTDQIRVSVTVTGGWSFTRIAEVEAWEAE